MWFKPKKGAITIDTLIDQVLPLASEVFGCLHKQVDSVFTQLCQCHLELEKVRRFHLFVWVKFFRQKKSITLQKMQASSILSWEVVVGLATFGLSPLQDTPSITMANLL